MPKHLPKPKDLSLINDPLGTLDLKHARLNDSTWDDDVTIHGRGAERRTKSTKHHRGRAGVLNHKKVDKGTTIGGRGVEVAAFKGRIGKGVDAEVAGASADVGKFVDRNGQKHFGLQGKAGVLSVDRRPTEKKQVGFDAGLLNASGTLHANKRGAGFGIGANVVEGAFQAGHDDKDFFRLGGSVGVGLGGRVTYGRNDNHKRQVGFGFDAGPLSLDIKSTMLPHLVHSGKKNVNKARHKVGHALKKTFG